MTPLPTLLAELEEALKAATPGPWKSEAQGGSSTVLAPTLPGRNDTRFKCAYGYREDRGYCIAYPFLSDEKLDSLRFDFVSFSHEDARLIALMRTHLPTLIEAVKRQGEAKDTPIWGVWVDYNRAPPGSYACLVSSFVNGQWSDPEARWMPAQGRPALQGQIRIMPHLMPNDPLTAHKEATDV